MHHSTSQLKTRVCLLAVLVSTQIWLSTAGANADDELLAFVTAAQLPNSVSSTPAPSRTPPANATQLRMIPASPAPSRTSVSTPTRTQTSVVSVPRAILQPAPAAVTLNRAPITASIPTRVPAPDVLAPHAAANLKSAPVTVDRTTINASIPAREAVAPKPMSAVKPIQSGQPLLVWETSQPKPVLTPAPALTNNPGPAVTPRAQQRAQEELQQQQNVTFDPFTAVPEEPVAASKQDDVLLKRTNALPTAEALNRSHHVAGPGESAIREIFYHAAQIALKTSPQLRSAQFNASAAEANVKEAKGQRWPQVDVGTSSRSYQFGGGEKTKQSNTPAVNLNMATTLFDFGQISNTIDSRQKTAAAADIAVNASAEDLAWQVSQALVELSKQRLIIELSQQYVARMKELVKMLSGIVGSDPGRRSELTQAKGRELQAQSSLDNALAKTRETEITLHKLIGNTDIALPRTAQWNLQQTSVERLLSAVNHHPVVRQAQAQAEAAVAEAKAVRSSNLPKVNWVVSKNTAEDQFGRQQAWQTGVNVSWGLFRGGSGTAAEQAALQRAEASREQIAEQLRDLDYRIRNADQDARSMLQRADLYRNLTVESDRIRLAFFDQWYHLGKRTLLDVLSAESDYYNNRVAEVTNRFDSYSAIFRGYASAGQLIPWLSGNLR